MLALALSNPSSAGSDSLETVGDVLQILIPGAALGKTYLDDDREGRIQFWKTAGTTFGVVHGTKAIVGKLRPNRANTSSFPSGHTASAFTGAAFFHHRYGWKWGAPAYALAGVVGYSRIDADAHYADDVLAGANVAILSSLYFVSPRDDGISVSPMAGDAVGAEIRLSNEALANQRKAPEPYSGKWHYTFNFGPAYLQKNLIGIPEAKDSAVDVEDFEGENDPLTTALSVVEYRYAERQSLYASFVPYELRERTTLEEAVTLDGVTYNDSDELRVQYRYYDLVLGWQYYLLNNQRWDLRAGLELSMQRTLVEFDTSAGDKRASASDWTFMATPAVDLRYQFTRRLSGFGYVSGADYADSRLLNAGLGLRWQWNRQWDTGIKLARYERAIDSGELENELEIDSLLLEVGYRF